MGLSEENYVCSLSADTAKFAKQDLREDEATREHGLKAMREWLSKNADIKNCRTDSVFLLRFLRCRKFSIPQAQELLERYLAIRQTYPHWFRKLDVDEADLLEIIDAGYIIPLPEKDCFGRQIILTRPKGIDALKFNSVQMARVHSLVCEVLMDDEESQVRGFVHVNDEDGLTMSHLSMWSFADVRSLINCIQKSTPMRLKGTHFVNLPGIANVLFEFFLSLLNDKLRGRIQTHKSNAELQKAVDINILPKEYGGSVPMKDMIEQFKAKLKSQKSRIASLEPMTINIKPGSKLNMDISQNDDLLGVTGSFRKLEVD
ncbi:clavesin-1-like [Neocloeon triangulifer]|uniref:clavesin-1-like n=1 Tax=Neocloeon triangulifer TaxID=2078957 RepID=UPI00286EDF7C|nr:clavesin-1-like [Neocloeon triangulifer]XP_059490720.1 clavesin-1-like [Neocloeon triangulifer]